MPESLVLLNLYSKNLIEATGRLRNLPERPRPGEKLCYTMDILWGWDLCLLIIPIAKIAFKISKRKHR